MINILEKYIAKTIVYATVLTALIVSGVLFLMTLLAELKNVGEGDYGFSQALLYVLMRMPAELYHFAPILILLGCMAGLSVLTTYREIAVMRVSGFSTQQLIVSALGAVLLLTLAMGLVGEGMAPKLSYVAQINKENDRNAGQAVVTTAGIWMHVGNNFIHVEHVVNRQLLEDVTRYQFDGEHHLLAAYYAKVLAYQDGQWVMSDAVKTSFYPDRTRSQAIQRGAWDLTINTNLLKVGLVDPAELSLPRLSKFARYLEQNGLQSSAYRYEFWQRIFQPFASLVMVFLALPFVLGALSAMTLGVRMLVGVLVGFGFFISNAFLGQICIVYQVPAVLAAFLPIVLFVFIAFVLSKRLIKL